MLRGNPAVINDLQQYPEVRSPRLFESPFRDFPFSLLFCSVTCRQLPLFPSFHPLYSLIVSHALTFCTRYLPVEQGSALITLRSDYVGITDFSPYTGSYSFGQPDKQFDPELFCIS